MAAAPVAVDDTFTVDEDNFLLAGDGESAWTAAIQQSQPLHWWRFEETSGGVIADAGSAGAVGTLGVGVILGQAGAVGRAAYFDGTGAGYVKIAEPQLTGDWSVETIVSVELGGDHAQSILGSATEDLPGGQATTLRIVQHPDRNSIGYTQFGMVDWDSDVPSPTELTHIAWVKTSSGIDIYVDGTLAIHMNAVIALSRHAIGSGHFEEWRPYAHDPLKGLLDELTVYDRALTAQEIAQHAQAMRTTATGEPSVIAGVLANDTDADGQTLTAEVVTPPAHGDLLLKPTGEFYYVADFDFHGSDQFTYRAFDGTSHSNVATVTIQVRPINDPPVANIDRDYQVGFDAVLEVDASTGLLVNDTDVDGDPLSVRLVSAPRSGTLQLNADGSFRYTPRDGWVGRDVFTYRAFDGTAESETAQVSIRVTRPNANAAAARDDFYTVDEDGVLDIDDSPWLSVTKVPLEVAAMAYDAAGDRLLVVVPSGAGLLGGTLTEIDPYTGQIGRSVPLPGRLGLVVVSDDGKTIHVTVEDSHAVQIIDGPSLSLGPQIRFGSPRVVAHQILAVPNDSDGVLIVSWDNSISQPAGTVIYDYGVARPHAAGGNLMAFDETGEHLYGYENWLSSSYFWEHEVRADGMRVIREHPWGSMMNGHSEGFQVAQGHLFTMGGGSIINIDSRQTVGRFDGPWAFLASGLENALYTFDEHSQQFHVYDLANFHKRVSVDVPSVGPVNRQLIRFGDDGVAVVNSTDIVLVRSDELFGITRRGVLRNDALAGQVSPQVQLLEGTAHGALELRSDGTFRYEPAANYHGTDQFRYRYLDGKGVEQTATAHITVRPVNDVPEAKPDEYRLTAIEPLNVTAAAGVLANDIDAADGDALAAVLVRQPRAGTVTLRADGSFTYQPNASFVISDSFTYRASDGQGLSEPQTVEIRLDVPSIDVGTHVLKANTPNQRIDIFVEGGQLVAGIDLFAQIGDGGPETATLGLPAGSDGPSITRVELKQGTIFASIPDAPSNLGSLPQLANWSISVAEEGNVSADGLLATLIVDTTGFFEGKWDLSLVGALPNHPLGPLDTRFADMLADIRNGSIEIVPARITGRHIFYNNSTWDQNDPAANAADDLAIAPDKQALLPGETATYANYTNYTRGINGVMLDIVGLPSSTTLTAEDFELRAGRHHDPSMWTEAPSPVVTTRRGAGEDGADRVTLTWPDGAIVNSWLEVRVKYGARTLLGHDDVFYFGNAIGETGSQPGNTFVSSVDVIAARDNQRGPFDLAPIDDVHDFNRDRVVTSADVIAARDHQAGALTAIPLIAAPMDPVAATPAPSAAADALWFAAPLTDSLFRHIDRPIGDVNWDGRFDSSDLVLVFQRGKYRASTEARDATWADGDWDGDGDFDDDDLLLVLANIRQEALAS